MLVSSKREINIVKSPIHKQNTNAGSGSTFNEIDEESETGKVKKSSTQYV